MKHLYSALFLCLTFICKSQVSSQNFSVLKSIETDAVQVLLEPDDCRKCKKVKIKNNIIKEAVDEFLTVAKSVDYHYTTKEFKKASKKDKKEKLYLDYYIESVEHKRGNYIYYTYLHYLYLVKRTYKTKYRKALKTKLLVGYRFGETPFNYDTDVLEMFPLAIKVMNAYLKDAQEYKTLNPEIIANNNWRKCEINELQIYRGFLKKKELDEIGALESGFSVPINYIGFNEILQKVYTGEPSEKISIMAIPNLDNSAIKKSRGNYYYFIDLNTGKLYYKEDIKGLRTRFFGKKDMERITSRAKTKYKAPKK